MRLLRLILGLALAGVLQLLFVEALPSTARAVDPLLVVIVLNALDGHHLWGAFGGLAAGWVEDGVTGSLFGLHGTAGTLVGFAVATLSRQVSARQPFMLALVIAAAALAEEAVLALLLRLLMPGSLSPNPLWAGIRALVTATAGVVVVLGWRRGTRGYRQWRRTRKSRIRVR